MNKFSDPSMIKVGNVIEFNAEYKNGKNNLGLGTITKIDDNNVTIDLNHPLAGLEIIFKVKIIEVNRKLIIDLPSIPTILADEI